MWFANFSDEVKDKIVNSSQDIMDIVAKYGGDPTSLDKKDTDSLIKEIADAPHDEKKSGWPEIRAKRSKKVQKWGPSHFT